MSRIGRKAIAVPTGVQVDVKSRQVTVKGSKGQLAWTIPMGIKIDLQDNKILVSRQKDDRQSLAYHGLVRAMVANMIQGVNQGFSVSLEIEGVGYRAQMKGKTLEMSLGFSHPVTFPVPDGIEIQVETPTLLHVRGIDKQRVGQVAADIRHKRPPEPYKGKGIRYKGEHIIRKAGKAGA